jgi:glycosyltransferase involved in cell wall biosynthesis
MKILYLSRSNSGFPHVFIKEQADALEKNLNIEIEHLLIKKGGVSGCIKALSQLVKYSGKNNIDIIHVHYGLWAMIAVVHKHIWLKRYKIIITFHGSDIFKPFERRFSVLASHFAEHNILVSGRMSRYFKNNYSIVPCGIDTDIELVHRDKTRKENGWSENDFVILFSSNFKRQVKDPDFAFRVVKSFSAISSRPVQFIEMTGYTREQVTALMQAADVLLMCSISEGSPQVIKEAVLNGLPVISNDVGDVRSICFGIDHCFILDKNVDAYVKFLELLSGTNSRIENRDLIIRKFDNNTISKKIYGIYKTVLSGERAGYLIPSGLDIFEY